MVPEIARQRLLVPARAEGLRLDQFLAESFPERSRAFFQKCIDERRIEVNGGKAVKKSQVLRGGFYVVIDWPNEEPFEPAREHIDFPILYEDGDLLVVDKPPGMAVHPGVGHANGTLVNALLGYDFDVFSKVAGEAHRPGIVHRLDKDTTGALVVAKHDQAKTNLSGVFRERRVEKHYLAVVVGRPPEDVQTIENQIGRHPSNRKKMAVVQRHGKDSVTHYQVLAVGDGASLVRLRIETGRTHQIRVHMAKIRCPVLGDTTYGARKLEPFASPRQMLHAWRLSFDHPLRPERLHFVAPVPDDMREALCQAGIDPAACGIDCDEHGLVASEPAIPPTPIPPAAPGAPQQD